MGGGVTTTVTVTVNGTPTTYNYNSSPLTITIPAGATYTLSFSPIKKYMKPIDNIVYGATPGDINNVSHEYIKMSNGVWIVDKKGDVYPYDKYILPEDSNFYYNSSNSGDFRDATGIALVTDNVSIIIAPTYRSVSKYYDTSITDSNEAFLLNNWKGNNYESMSLAQMDFNGEKNTNDLINALGIGAWTANLCRDYSAGCRDVGEWYLPSGGEVNEIYNNKNAINNALGRIGGDKLIASSSNSDSMRAIWTSSVNFYKDSYNQYNYRMWASNYFDSSSSYSLSSSWAYDEYGVRAVCQL